MNKKELYGTSLVLANLFLIFSLIMFIVYLAAPLLGGKLSTHALMAYASWIGIALVGKVVIKRALNGLPIRMYDYSLICFLVIVNVVIWFSYPINVVLSILCVIGTVISYKTQRR